jgi:dihydrofolate reductase
MPARLSAIAAMDKNRLIGKDNQLPWHLPADLAHFKAITTGHPILMGRKTHESIGRPLPNRHNIVLTRDLSYEAEGITIVHSLDEALAACPDDDEIFIIGGAEIYRLALPRLQRLYLTFIDHAFTGDVYFPAWAANEWQEISREAHEADEKNAYGYAFVTLERS